MATRLDLELTQQKLCRTSVELCDWLFESGVQAREGHFHAWYDLETGAFVRPYPEITGYGISTLCWLFDRSGDPELLDRAERAFDFLVADAIHPVWDLVGTQRLSTLERLEGPTYLHAFDSGIVAASLERLARRTADARLDQVVDRIGNAFLKRLLLDDGTVWPLIDTRDGISTSGTRKWSQGFSGYQLKSLMFLMLHEASCRSSDVGSAVRRTLEKVLAGQQSCGAFPSYPSGETHLHPHLYTLEALSVAAAIHGELRWLERVVAGYSYLEDLILAQGYLPTRVHSQRITVPFERADIVAQFLRLGSYLCSVGCLDQRRLDTVLLWARRRLQRYVIEDGPHRGGVLFGQDWDGTVKRHVNCAVTLISVQAFHWYEAARNQGHVDPLELV